MREVHEAITAHSEDEDSGRCRGCGDALGLDGVCDCAGDEDRDRVAGLRGLKGARVLTMRDAGMRVTRGWERGRVFGAEFAVE
jgi:hypothetical protein